MIDKDIWKTRTDRDKMEKLIKYHMHVMICKKHLFAKKTHSQETVKQILFFFYESF